MHYYQFNIADYRKDTTHLSRLEHGIYRDLMDWYYLDETPIPEETQSVSRRLRLETELEASALENVLSDFFTLCADGYHHKRIDQEIADYYSICAKNKENGKKGGRPKGVKPLPSKEENPVGSQSQPTGNPNETQINPNHKPLTTNHEPSLKTKRAPLFNPADCVLPPSIDSNKWAEWIAYRKGRKLATSEATALKQIEFLADCAGKGIDAGKVIDDSIRQGWQGLFEPKQQQASKPGYQSIHEQRANTIAILTGKKSHERTTADERDITGESCRVAG